MGKIVTTLRSIPLRNYALFAILASVIAIPAALWAWGPDRPTYTIEKPATRVAFNSITNNPHIGDERNFVGIREDGTNGKWQDNQKVERGKQYVVRMYVHNNAAASLNLVANNVTAKFRVPTNTAKSLQVNGFLSASNATPREVYDHAVFTGAEDFNLAVVPGSIKYFNNAGTFTIPESIFTANGAKLGYSKMDGNIPGCFQYAGYLTFIVKPQFAPKHDFTMEKKVSKHGANKWTKDYQAQPGETIDFLVKYKNTGEVQQNNVTFRDKLPAGLQYVAGSTVLGNSKTPKGAKVSDNLTTAAGINVGSYAKGANAWVIFSAKVAEKEQLACGANSLRNVAAVVPEGAGQKEDDATVTVTKDCPPAPQPKDITVCRLSDKQVITIKENQFDSAKHSKNLDDCKEAPKPVYTCDALTIVKIARDEFKFKATHSLSNGVAHKSTVFKVFDANGKEVYNSINGEFKGFAAGSYTVKAFVTFTVNGKDETVTSQGCEKQFTIDQPEPKDITVCRLSDKTYPVTIKETEFDSKLHSKNPADCQEAPQPKKITVCVIETGVVTPINEQDFDAKKHTNDLSKCEKVQRCFIPEKRIVEIARKDITDQHTEDLSKCAPAPVTPPVTPPTPPTPSTPPVVHELPRTGADLLVGGLGLGALITAGAAYVASRRTLG
ncbi:MAG: hypothetical protein Q4A37_00500 [Candidatus Saccharibacteria bacterium]|nr:hypothetical protein [Candidatus Saccharibacteria bacterium]